MRPSSIAHPPVRTRVLSAFSAGVWLMAWGSPPFTTILGAALSAEEGLNGVELYAISNSGVLREPWSLFTWISLCGMAFLWSTAGIIWMQRRIRALESNQDESAKFSRHLIRTQEHERSRIAGELHDGLGHELQLIRNSAQMALNQSADDPRMMAHLNAISQTALRAIEGVRAISKGLVPPELHHLGLSSALDQLARRVQQSFAGSVDSRVDNIDGLLDAERELDVFRIAQEALGNALKHSSATEITFEVQRHLRAIQISIFDNGSGFDTRLKGSDLGSGLGLVNMDKRAEWLGTHLELRSERGKGTRITLDVPLSRETPSP